MNVNVIYILGRVNKIKLVALLRFSAETLIIAMLSQTQALAPKEPLASCRDITSVPSGSEPTAYIRGRCVAVLPCNRGARVACHRHLLGPRRRPSGGSLYVQSFMMRFFFFFCIECEVTIGLLKALWEPLPMQYGSPFTSS